MDKDVAYLLIKKSEDDKKAKNIRQAKYRNDNNVEHNIKNKEYQKIHRDKMKELLKMAKLSIASN